jgi:DNA-binding CsgD family transcriptional regulator/tetratricopeptide (TPR) repeat protein
VRRRERTPNLIGRESALSALGEALGDVAEAGSVVLVRGEVGIGKTRLLEGFAARVAEEAHVVRGGCVEGVSYAPWTEALRRLLSPADVVAVDDLPRRVRSQIARLLPHLSLDEAETAGGEKSGGQHLLFEAVVELLTHVALRTRLVLVVDDLHWVDPASSELIRYVANNLGRAPILLVVTYRAEDAAAQRALIAQLARLATRQIALTPLAEDSTAEIAEILLGPDASPADIRRIAHAADGNPLFVEELVAALGTTGVPQTVRDLMLARFSVLDEHSRHLVRTAAVIGATAPQAWLAAAAGLDDNATRLAARAAVDRGLLIAGSDGTSYHFRHALLRHAVLDELLPDDRVALHNAIAAALTAHPAVAVGVDRIAELARHWDTARDASSALRWLVAAADQAGQRFAFEAAFDDYERALGWWESVDDAPAVAGIDHAALLLDAADAAGLAGHTGRAADLARAGLDEAYALDASRGVEAAGRVYPLLWQADRAAELFEFSTTTLLPVLDRVDPGARARFLVSRVEHLVAYGTTAELREPAAQMMAALQGVNDPVLEARAYLVSAWCYEAYGDFERVEAEYERAAEIARNANAPSMLALVLYNHAAFKTDFPDLQGSVTLLDEVDALVERFGLRRYLVVSRRQRSLTLCMQGELAGAAAAMASIDDVFTEGFDAWARAMGRAYVDYTAGNSEAVLRGLRPDVVGAAAPEDSELVIETEMLRADALAWNGDVEGARRAVDRGEAAVAAEHYRETYWHGHLAMVGVRIEADNAVAAIASQSIGAIENAEARAREIVAAWETAVAQLARSTPLLDAYTMGIDAEVGRLRREEAVGRAHRAAEAFAMIGFPYYATYFRWREAEATLDAGDRPLATELLKRARATATIHGFAGLDTTIVALARAHQLRLGPARTTIDGDEALSVRELEVLRLVASGKSNPDIAETLFISRRTAAAHVSNILRKLDATSRVEAVSEAHRRAIV